LCQTILKIFKPHIENYSVKLVLKVLNIKTQKLKIEFEMKTAKNNKFENFKVSHLTQKWSKPNKICLVHVFYLFL